MPQSPKTWLAVFDGASAKLYAVDRAASRLEEVDALDGPHRPEFDDDRTRVQESAGPGRSAVEPRTDPERRLEAAFVERVVARLDAHMGDHPGDHLIVAAGPRALGAFRACAGDALKARVIAEHAKNWVNTPTADIVSALDL
jgi:protein required for attachment to host cells